MTQKVLLFGGLLFPFPLPCGLRHPVLVRLHTRLILAHMPGTRTALLLLGLVALLVSALKMLIAEIAHEMVLERFTHLLLVFRRTFNFFQERAFFVLKDYDLRYKIG